MKTFVVGWKVFLFSWRASGIWSLLTFAADIIDDTLYPLLLIFLVSKVIDILNKPGIHLADFYGLGLLFLFFIIIKIIISNLANAKAPLTEFEFESYLDVMLAKKLSEIDPAKFEEADFQNLISQLDGIIGGFYNSMMRFMGLLSYAVKILTASIVLLPVFPFFVPVIILSTIPYYLAYDNLREKTWPFFGAERAPLLRIIRYIRTLLSSDGTAKEIAIYQTGTVLVSKLKTERKSFFRRFTKAVAASTFPLIWTNIFQFIAFIVTQFYAISFVMLKKITVGQFAFYFQQTMQLTQGSEQLLSMYSSMSQRNKYMDLFEEFMATEPIIKNSENVQTFPTNPMPPVIEFKNVNFKYPKTDKYILKDFNLTIKSGEKVAIVGENGAGKSTLVKLLLRFYDVSEGEILLNGVNIKEIDIFTWRAKIGALFQDFIKYQFSFKENVYFGNLQENNNEKLLGDAIDKSGAQTYMQKLPDGINQIVGKMFDKGIDLSGGQWQKLALARAFFRDAPVLILDEPTSAIDAKAEYEIFQRVQDLQQDKTVIIISHRFSTVRNADTIVVVDEGKIVESGNHKELMKKKGLYHELFTIQAKGYQL